jgi:PleD family two-component response regulator
MFTTEDSNSKSKAKILIVDDEKSNCDIIIGFMLILGIKNRKEITEFAYDG